MCIRDRYDTITITQPTQLISTLTKTNVSCNSDTNGSAVVVVGGATPPYSYVWSNGKTSASINNLGIGRYIVTITDSKGCNKSDTADIIQPNPLNATPVSYTHLDVYKRQVIHHTLIAGILPPSKRHKQSPVLLPASTALK